MNKILYDQLIKLKSFNHTVDGKLEEGFPESFSEIVFFKKQSVSQIKELCVVFEDYIVQPFEGFDFHDKFNNGVPPYDKIMYGTIERETEKMYYLKVHSITSDKIWTGWCPKKSCKIR